MTENTNRVRVLICSVGGSPAPIRTALATMRPDRAIFVVSDGKAGPSSRDQVTGERLFDRYGKDIGSGLRHSDGCPSDVRVLDVPADDPDRAFALIEPCLAHELAMGHEVTVDYTGGTKSMSSALFLAATALQDVRVQFMQGERPDLLQVRDGSECVVELPTFLIRMADDFATASAFLRRRDYAAALVVLEDAEKQLSEKGGRKAVGAPKRWTGRLALWRDFARLLDLWDRFEHRKAWQALEDRIGASPEVGQAFDGFRDRLKTLAESQRRPSAALVEDLWLNAQRRAAAGRYDDAIARCYRLMEAAVQARLWERHRFDTGDVPKERLPADMRERIKPVWDEQTRREVLKLALSDALALLRHLAPDDPLSKVKPHEINSWQGQRNRSILAHGFVPLGADAWRTVESWFEERKSALWEDALGRSTAAQLPDHFPHM